MSVILLTGDERDATACFPDCAASSLSLTPLSRSAVKCDRRPSSLKRTPNKHGCYWQRKETVLKPAIATVRCCKFNAGLLHTPHDWLKLQGNKIVLYKKIRQSKRVYRPQPDALVVGGGRWGRGV